MTASNLSNIDFTPFIQTEYSKKNTGELQDMVKKDDGFAAYELGIRYKAANNTQQAVTFFLLANKLNHPDAPWQAARILHYDLHKFGGVPQLLDDAIKRTNNPKAHTLLGKYYLIGKVGNCSQEERDRRAFGHFLVAAKQGYPEAQYVLSKAYASGTGVAVSHFDFVFWLRCAQLNGFGPAITDIKRTMSNRIYDVWKRNLKAVDKAISQHEEYIEEYYRQKLRNEIDAEDMRKG